VHFVGEMSGAAPPDFCVQELLQRYPNLKTRIPPLAKAIERQAPISYTQWEAWLALFLRKTMLIVIPSETAARGPKFAPTAETKKAQDDHLKRLKSIDLFPGDPFVNGDGLTIQILQSAVIPALKRAAREGVAAARQPRNLPFISLGDLFKGRDKQLEALHSALAAANGAGVLVRALHGLGGIGKSRLAVEYAWKHEAEYSALLFVRAESAAALNANLAALVGAFLLDLPEKGAREDAAKIEAVLRWLEASPTWLLILDNVDDSDAVAAVTALMPRLNGGHVIVTARRTFQPPSVSSNSTCSARTRRRSSCWNGRPTIANGQRTTMCRPGCLRANSVASRSGSNRRVRRSRPIASASPAILSSGTRAGRSCSLGPIRP
jgi:hypothetical protein